MTHDNDLAALCVEYESAKSVEKIAKERAANIASKISEHFPSKTEFDFNCQHEQRLSTSSHDVTIKFLRPVETEWDQDALQDVYDEMIDNAINPNNVLHANFKVDNKALPSVPPQWADAIKSCGVVSGYKKNGDLRAPRITVKVVAK